MLSSPLQPSLLPVNTTATPRAQGFEAGIALAFLIEMGISILSDLQEVPEKVLAHCRKQCAFLGCSTNKAVKPYVSQWQWALTVSAIN